MGLWNKGVIRSKYNMLRREDLTPDVKITPEMIKITDEDYSHFYIKKYDNAIEVFNQNGESICFYILSEQYQYMKYKNLDIYDIVNSLIPPEGRLYENMLFTNEFKHAVVMTYNSIKKYKDIYERSTFCSFDGVG